MKLGTSLCIANYQILSLRGQGRAEAEAETKTLHPPYTVDKGRVKGLETGIYPCKIHDTLEIFAVQKA